jgi:hypothetical protein
MNMEYDQVDDHTLVIRYGAKEITRFNYNNFEIANRPYLFPVYTPNGISATRHFPMEQKENEKQDHPHHTGVWTAWGDVNGVDNWAKGPKKGRQIVKSVQPSKTEDGITLQMVLDWTTTEGVPNLAETRTIKFYDPDSAVGKLITNGYIMDFKVEFQTKYGPVKFGDTKEGGLLSVRVPTPLDVPRGGKIRNALGKTSTNEKEEKQVWGKRAVWCEYSGQTEGKQIGITIIDSPFNPIAPTYWHVRNYGLMTANPFGKSHFVFPLLKGSMKVPANSTSVWNYRLVVFDGTIDEAEYTKLRI